MIHVLGAGAIGSLLAHQLAARTPITLLVKNAVRATAYQNRITVHSHHGGITTTSSSHVATATPESVKNTPISDLIVATKCYHTLLALAPYVANLGPNSNVLFVQNGMGVVEECIEKLFPTARPNIYRAIVSHGAYKTRPNVVHHVGHGRVIIGPLVPLGSHQHVNTQPANTQPANESLSAQPANIQHANTQPVNGSNGQHAFAYASGATLQIDVQPHADTPLLSIGTLVTLAEITTAALEKLVVNACINPLTTVLDCANGALLAGSTQMVKTIVKEVLRVIRKEYQLDDVERATVLNERRLVEYVYEVAQITAQNSSSMREDVRNASPTEIDYINGWVVRLGQKHNVPTPANRYMVEMVKLRSAVERHSSLST